MKKHHLLPLLLLPLVITGCGTEHISERLYTQTLGLTGQTVLTLHAQAFGKDGSFSAEGSTAAEALQNSETSQGNRIFIGHTELLCLDGSRTLADIEDLLFSQGLSPACKLLYADVEASFENSGTPALLECIRMSERTGRIGITDISTVLDEWLSEKQTALLPASSGDALRMVLLRTDGSRTLLSEDAACGMYWLRRSTNDDFVMTVETEKGMEDVPILRCSLQKTASESGLCYAVTVYTDDCPEQARRPLQERILTQCHAAVSEMLAADADVIGLQTLADFSGLDSEDIPVEITVSIQ